MEIFFFFSVVRVPVYVQVREISIGNKKEEKANEEASTRDALVLFLDTLFLDDDDGCRLPPALICPRIHPRIPPSTSHDIP